MKVKLFCQMNDKKKKGKPCLKIHKTLSENHSTLTGWFWGTHSTIFSVQYIQKWMSFHEAMMAISLDGSPDHYCTSVLLSSSVYYLLVFQKDFFKKKMRNTELCKLQNFHFWYPDHRSYSSNLWLLNSQASLLSWCTLLQQKCAPSVHRGLEETSCT